MTRINKTSNPQGRHVQANGLNIYYEEYGSGTPMILLHGSLDCTSSMWKPQIPLLEKHFRVMVPDARGHGRTDNPEERTTLPLLADDVVAFSRALSLEKPILCGVSMGGLTVLEAGMRHPSFFRALIVGAAQAHRPFPQTILEQMRAIGIHGPGDVNPQVFEMNDPQRVARLRTAHPLREDQWKRLLLSLSHVLFPSCHPLEDYRKITMLTLLIVGDRDHAVRLEDVVDMYRFLPDAEMAVLPGHTHVSFFQKSDGPFGPLVLDFLLRHLANNS